MKPRHHNKTFCWRGLAMFALPPLITGCWDAGLPAEMPVLLPDDSTIMAPTDAGASSLANSDWSIYTDSQPPDLLLRLQFNENGDVIRVYDNTVYSDVIGQELIPNGLTQASPWPAGSYVAECYVAERDSYVGFVCLGNANLGPWRFGTSTLTFAGSMLDSRIEGSLALTIEVDPAFVSMLPFTPGLYEQQVFAVPVGSEPPENGEDTPGVEDVPSDALAIQLDVPAGGSLQVIEDEDWFTFALDQPLAVTVETSGVYGDTVVWLYDANMSQIGFDDDGGDDLFSRIVTAGLPTGVYYIKVEGFGGQVIDEYTITVSGLTH